MNSIRFSTKIQLVITILSFSLSLVHAQAPDFDWGKQAGGNTNANRASGLGIDADAAGNTYTTGSFTKMAVFSGITLTTLGDSSDAYLAKYDSAGSMLWVKQGTGTGLGGGGSIAVDHQGNSYVTGGFRGSISFGSVTLSGNASNTGFVAKFDPQGNCIWATSFGNTSLYTDITISPNGNLYLTGAFTGTGSFGSFTLTSLGSVDAFIACITNQGSFLWARQGGGSGVDIGEKLVSDAAGNCYVTGNFGYFSGGTPATAYNALFDSVTLQSSGLTDIFIAKYDASGSLQWARQAGGTEYDMSTGIGVDSSLNIYLTGYFDDSIRFDRISILSNGSEDIFIAKFDSSGNALWAQRAGGSSNWDYSHDLAVDAAGNCYITGDVLPPYNTPVYFGNLSITFYKTTAMHSHDAYIVKYNTSGNALWVKGLDGGFMDRSFGIAIDQLGNSYITGCFTGVLSMGTDTLVNSGGQDMLVAKLLNTPVLATAPSVFSDKAFSVYPNPIRSGAQLHLTSLKLNSKAEALIYSLSGNLVFTQHLASLKTESDASFLLPDLPPGVYILKVVSEKQVFSQKLLIE